MLRQLLRQLSIGLESKLVFSRSFSTSKQLQKDDNDASTTDSTTPPQKEKQTVVVDKDKNITLIGINRPDKRNAINSTTASKLCEVFRKFEDDETSPVAVLYGVGGSFCAGYDILELATDNEEKVSIEMLMMPEGSVGPTRRHIRKPVVCGINGYCVANGLELALMCDLRVMEETAVLGFFNRRFGVPVIDGGSVRLPAMIGISRSLDLILTGRQVDATEAHQMGIANRIVPTGESLHKALELARQISKFPQGALNHDRNSLYSSVYEANSFNVSIQNEIMYTSKDIIEDMQEGIKWFNRTFAADATHSWLQRDKSMADWDDEKVAAAAAKIEEQKQAEEVARIEAERKEKEEKKKQSELSKQKQQAETSKPKEQTESSKPKEQAESSKPKEQAESSKSKEQTESSKPKEKPDDKNDCDK